MRVTQRQIARAAKVSQATVSRVLAGNDNVLPELRDRVLSAFKEHNYTPDSRARSLRGSRTGLVGLVIRRPESQLAEDPFILQLVTTISRHLSEVGYHLCLEFVGSEPCEQEIYEELLRTRRVDGLILVEPEARDPRIRRLNRDRFPFVLIGNSTWEDIHSVDNDNVLAGQLATEHLLEIGHRHVAFIAGPSGLNFSRDRVRGYRSAMSNRRLEPLILHAEHSYESALAAARGLLEGSQPPSAIVSLDDLMAAAVAEAADELGVALPGDLALIGFNDSSICRLVAGGLSSVNLETEQLVDAACTRLLDLIEMHEPFEPERTIVPCRLVVRNSTLSTKNRRGK